MNKSSKLKTGGIVLYFIGLLSGTFYAGCEKVPLVSENRKYFAPWDKLPESEGIKYVDKFVRDNGSDPIYLALISYEDDSDLQKMSDTFGLTQQADLKPPLTFTSVLNPPPSWFPLENADRLYIYPQGSQQYASNMWVDTVGKRIVLERSWW